MTHPLHDLKGHGSRQRRVKQGEPFDPDELSRRLATHLAEQKLQAQRRRDARAAKAAAAQQIGVYHHVPKVAAAAFERTTTPDMMRQVHKLAQPALKSHLEHLTVDDPLPGQPATSLQRTQAMDQAMIERDLLRNRNQFQWKQDMEEAAEVDIARDLYSPPQRTFIAEFAHLRGRHAGSAQRPLSTGDMISEEEETTIKTRYKPTYDPKIDRNDWVQRDDETEARPSKKERSSSFLKKKESSWILRAKKSSKQDKDEAVAGIGDFGSPPHGSKSGKPSFLARFKRHPS
jgi:hypothetical protein